MRKQDRLMALINTLTQGERKFFVQSSRSGSSRKSYLRLYELLLNKKEYKADELCRLLKKSKADIANEKRYLEKNLLKALCIYHENNSQNESLDISPVLEAMPLYRTSSLALDPSLRHS